VAHSTTARVRPAHSPEKLRLLWVVSCKPEDDIRFALEIMAEAKVRRLPVVNADNRLEGLLSVDDVLFHTESRNLGKVSELSPEDVVNALKKLYAPRLPQPVPQKAAAA
jgi:CBS domain-containing protein